MMSFSSEFIFTWKRGLLAFGLVIFSLYAQATEENLPSKITIGLTPGGRPDVLKTQALEVAKEIQNQFQVPVEVYVSKDYSSLVDAMKQKKVDFGFFSSMSFVFAENSAGAKVLLKRVWSDPFYFSAVVVRSDSKIKSLSQLKNKTMAFVDKNSTSGYLYPQVMLKKKYTPESFFKEIQFSGNHSQSVALLEEKKVDAIAVFSDDKAGTRGAWTKFSKNKKDWAHPLWVSDPIPSDPLAVRKDFYEAHPKFTHSLMFYLIDLFQQNKNEGKYSEVLGSKDLMPATSKQYDPVREMVKSLNLELK